MTLKMEGQPFPLQLVVWACVIAFLVCFAVALYANIMAIRRTGGLINRAEDQDRSWGERQGRKSSRFGRFFVAEEFRSLRRLSYSAWTGAVLSFGSLLLLMFLFGDRASP
jgi:hypothetical protein